MKADISLSSGTSKISDFNVANLEYDNSYGNATFTNINVGDSLLPSDVTFDSFGISMSSGNCTINSLVCNSLDIENSYGDISCNNLSVEEFNSDLSSGNLTVSKSVIGNSDISNSYGDVKLSLTGNAADYMLDLDTSYGMIYVDGQSYEESLVRENGGKNNIAADLSSGDIELNFE